MATTRIAIEAQITAKMNQTKGLTRQEAIEELLQGAKRGALAAEKAVVAAQGTLAETEKRLTKFKQARNGETVLDSDVSQVEAEIDSLKKVIQNEGRLASKEHHRIAVLNSILKEEP